MRIALVVTSLAMGGAERMVLELASRLASRDHQVILIVLEAQAEQEWPAELPVVRLNMDRNPFHILAGLIKARHTLAKFAPDLVHSHCFHANLLARMMRLAGIHARVLNTVHNIYEGPWYRMLAYGLTDGLADGVAFVCTAAAARYRRLHAVGKWKARVVVNGIDTELYRANAEERMRLRIEMKAADRFVWLNAGRLTRAKDIPNLLRAFVRVLDTRMDAELWIAGDDIEGGREELEAMAATLGISYAVRWLGVRRDLPAWMDAADGFVLASAWEGMPLVLAEAMAKAKPVVATEVGGVRELVGGEGRVAAAGDSKALAQAMLDVMSMPEAERLALGRQARERMLAGFSLEAWAARWLALYRELLEPGA